MPLDEKLIAEGAAMLKKYRIHMIVGVLYLVSIILPCHLSNRRWRTQEKRIEKLEERSRLQFESLLILEKNDFSIIEGHNKDIERIKDAFAVWK